MVNDNIQEEGEPRLICDKLINSARIQEWPWEQQRLESTQFTDSQGHYYGCGCERSSIE